MVISIFKFLSRYYGLSLNAASNCTHMDAKKNFEFIECCSVRFARENEELVDKGVIVYVEDTSGVVRPYFCPSKRICEECVYVKLPKKICCNDKDLLKELVKLPTYKVCELLGKYKDNIVLYKMIKKELINRGIYDNKIYKINKEIVGLKESGKDDKCKRRLKIKCKKS